MKTARSHAYCDPHREYPGLSGSPCPAQSEGQGKIPCGQISAYGGKPVDYHESQIFEPMADEYGRCRAEQAFKKHSLLCPLRGDDLLETFAAIGLTLDETNPQMTSLLKTINKHFAVQSHSKVFRLPILTLWTAP